MRVLRLVAVNESGSHLLLRAEGDGTEFVLPLDNRVRAAINGDKERLGQLEVPLESKIRPREIQSRIRAGESVESLAHSANVPVERIMRYAGPVLAERSHIADLARRSTLRRANGSGPSAPAPMLDDAVTAELAGHDVAEEEIRWDAYRREDGRWVVKAGWRLDDTECTAEWTFDPSGRSVSPANEEARWLGGERPPAPPPGPARLTVVGWSDSQGHDNVRPLVPTERHDNDPFDEDDFGADALDLVGDHDDPDTTPTVEVPVIVASDTAPQPAEDPGGTTGSPSTDDADDGRLRLSDIASHVEVEPGDQGDEFADSNDPPAKPPRAAAGSRSRRPSVPTWDEIMFGSRRRGD